MNAFGYFLKLLEMHVSIVDSLWNIPGYFFGFVREMVIENGIGRSLPR